MARTIRLSASEARAAWADLINRVAYGRERVVLHRRGRDAVAMVPVEDLELLEMISEHLPTPAPRSSTTPTRRCRQADVAAPLPAAP